MKISQSRLATLSFLKSIEEPEPDPDPDPPTGGESPG